ncbi:MAG: hypothetical protein ACQEXB_24395 [Bacillota bacterium]
MDKLLKEIEECGYECEAGSLELNVAWQELKEKVERYEREVQWLYGKLNMIGGIIEKSRGEFK